MGEGREPESLNSDQTRLGSEESNAVSGCALEVRFFGAFGNCLVAFGSLGLLALLVEPRVRGAVRARVGTGEGVVRSEDGGRDGGSAGGSGFGRSVEEGGVREEGVKV